MPLIKTSASKAARMAASADKIGPARGKSFLAAAMRTSGGQAEISGSRTELSSEAITTMLSKMTSYFATMVDPVSSRFFYRCLPTSGVRMHKKCPIRDLGSAWDTSTVLRFWNTSPALAQALGDEKDSTQKRLKKAVRTTIEAYSTKQIKFEDSLGRPCAMLPSKFLEEPSSIAHSAFLILAASGALRLGITPKQVSIEELVNGILSMQQESGAFAIHFGSGDISHGIEFYPGEAMLALMDAFEVSSKHNILSDETRRSILESMQKAFLFYSDYYRKGNVHDHYTSFFGNWQVQCFSRLYDELQRQEDSSVGHSPILSLVKSSDVGDYVIALCDHIVSSRSWQMLDNGKVDHLSTVEIACGLEAIAEGTQLALSSPPVSARAQRFWLNVVNAVNFLAAVQDQVPLDSTGHGGLGHALGIEEQRLDVTGHAVNALVKVYGVQSVLSEGSDAKDGSESSDTASKLAP